jgi:hypothetical protein
MSDRRLLRERPISIARRDAENVAILFVAWFVCLCLVVFSMLLGDWLPLDVVSLEEG